MKHVGPIELQNVSLTPEAFGRPVKRKSILRRLMVALHYSRRRQARNLIRSYRHLLADDILDRPSSASLDFKKEAVKMPTQIRRPSARVLAATTPDVSPNSLTPLTIIAILVFVLHLAGAAVLGHAQTGPAITSAVSDDAGCATAPRQKAQSLPYD